MWSELVSSAFVAGLSVAWIREALPPPLYCKPGALGLWGSGQGQVGQVLEMGLGVLKALSSKVKYLF